MFSKNYVLVFSSLIFFFFLQSCPEVPFIVKLIVILSLNVLPPLQATIMYILGIAGGVLIGLSGYRMIFTEPDDVSSDRESLGVQYSQVRVIPVIRRESIINDIKERNRRPSNCVIETIT